MPRATFVFLSPFQIGLSPCHNDAGLAGVRIIIAPEESGSTRIERRRQPYPTAAAADGTAGRLLSFRCLTQDGTLGTMTFELYGKPFPEENPYQLAEDRLFLVTTRGDEFKAQQLDREIRDAGNKAELEEVVKSDPKISAFVAGAETAD
jgi:hypothetical protein